MRPLMELEKRWRLRERGIGCKEGELCQRVRFLLLVDQYLTTCKYVPSYYGTRKRRGPVISKLILE